MKQQKVDLSIITPVFNAQNFIGLCIENVLAQGCKEVEHIIVDGGSTDGTVEIIGKYATLYPHIRWISEKDQGQSDAMNKGISIAKGQYISFLNADDFYDPGVLNRIIQLIQTQVFPVPSILIGKLNVLNESDQVIEVQFTEKICRKNVLKFWKRNIYPGNPTCYFYHKKLHESIGMYELDDHYLMDFHFFIKASRIAHFFYFDEVWGNFRFIPGTKTFENSRRGDSMRMKEELFHLYKKRLPFSMYIEIVYEYIIFKIKSNKSKILRRRLYHIGKRLFLYSRKNT
ncbi:glycosyltransferase [Rhodocytophaga rosea]|uniref:Glycosyltransferase n=1 Tax=Rhodocytophaga rosea TaxID=2704465 RepID=A0A6C0GNH1_9BACT|nr:glycosyltransferase family 2 protein [Rhodocytophaga rosea]QHT69591.1 glycosyltransferase [Rhodocytophaga rosea]